MHALDLRIIQVDMEKCTTSDFPKFFCMNILYVFSTFPGLLGTPVFQKLARFLLYKNRINFRYHYTSGGGNA